MEANKVNDSHRPPTDGGMAKEEFIRVGTTLYKIVEQPRLNGGYVRKRIAWNNETLRQDYGKDYIGSVPKYDGFCTVPEHVSYQPVIGKFLNLYEPIPHQPQEGDFRPLIGGTYLRGAIRVGKWTIFNCSTCNPFRSCPSCCWCRRSATQAKVHSSIF